MTTRNAYDSLERLTVDTTKNLSNLRQLVAAAVPTMVMDQLHPLFDIVVSDHRNAVKDLRADLDLLTVETNE